MYETLILIDPSTRISGATISEAIHGAFAPATDNAPRITGNESSLKISWPDFGFELYHAKEGHVLEESQEIAAIHAPNHPKSAAIASCGERIEIAGGDDPGMEHFNDYCFIVEAIEKLGTVYTFDSGSASFMNL